jgi:hypothetical protein
MLDIYCLLENFEDEFGVVLGTVRGKRWLLLLLGVGHLLELVEVIFEGCEFVLDCFLQLAMVTLQILQAGMSLFDDSQIFVVGLFRIFLAFNIFLLNFTGYALLLGEDVSH